MDQNSTQIDDSEMLVVAMTRPTMIGGFTLSIDPARITLE
jgi:type IV secretory pathway VirB3-like protein